MSSVFFGENGLTATSANHIANLAKEYIQGLESEIKSVSFINSTVQLIGSNEPMVVKQGCDAEALLDISKKLHVIADAKSLIAWLREAIKEKEKWRKSRQSITLEQYCALVDSELPTPPVMPKEKTLEEWIEDLPIKDRNRIFSLQTKAAVIGKYIHPDGYFASARKEMKNIKKEPNKIQGSGRDTLLYKYSESVPEENVEQVFFELQNEYRSVQAELNGLMHNIESAKQADDMERMTLYNQCLSEYNNTISQLTHDKDVYVMEELKYVQELKIVIPNVLKPIYETINSLGK